MDIYSLNSQIVYGSLDFLLQSQGSHIYHMDISFLHAHILYVSLDILFLKYFDNFFLLWFYIYLQIVKFMLNFACKYNKIVILLTFMQTGIIHNFNKDACFWPIRVYLCIDHHENPYGGWYVYWQLKFQILWRSVH